jgi:hypothetical protein
MINRSPSEVLEMVTPAEMWYGVKPDLRKVRVFGSVAYLHKPKELQAWNLIVDPGNVSWHDIVQMGIGFGVQLKEKLLQEEM